MVKISLKKDKKQNDNIQIYESNEFKIGQKRDLYLDIENRRGESETHKVFLNVQPN